MGLESLAVEGPVLAQDSNVPVERVKIEHRIGMLIPKWQEEGEFVERHFATTSDRWEEDAHTYLTFRPDRIVWLENRVVIESEWYQ